MALSKVGGNQIDTVSGDLTVDTNTLKVDAANNRVGVGLTAPEQPFHVRSSTFAYMRSESTNATYTGLDVGQHQSGYGVINMRDNQDIRFYTNDAEKLRIQAAGGISFNGDTATANALDDYEEGTFNPFNSATQPSNVSYSSATYTKVGRIVHCTIKIRDQRGSKSAVVFDLPFADGQGGDRVYGADFGGNIRNAPGYNSRAQTSGNSEYTYGSFTFVT